MKRSVSFLSYNSSFFLIKDVLTGKNIVKSK